MNSVITINFQRDHHLNNLIRGCHLSATKPDEIVIVNIGKTPKIIHDYGLNIKMINMKDDYEFLPIAKARNLGATNASFNNLHFLDVDCIPNIDYIEMMDYLVKKFNGLHMGSPRYLSAKVNEVFELDSLKTKSKHHHRRPRVYGVRKCNDAGLFWSLCFSTTKEVFEILGGFDETYTGYGAEDTDLSFKAREIGINFYLNEAVAFHQIHNFYKPPIKNIDSIVQNCNYFFRKWNIWAMDKHLREFDSLGLISWNKNQTEDILIQKFPSQQDIDNCLVKNTPYA
jgi:N-acetylglucosaminyl-diphospho-decaprenol L-rhamnosyltransferase